MTQNPPWASKIYAQVCDEIHEKVESLGLPMPMEDSPTSRGACVLDPELGAGHYGVVYRTIRNDTVFKITTDETEAHFVSLLPRLREMGVDPKGIVKYFGIFGVESTHRGRPVYVLWREAAEHVGKVADVFCKSGDLEHMPWQKEWKADDPYLCNQYKIFERLLHAWQKFCGLAREIYLSTQKKAYSMEASEDFWIWIDEQMQSIEREQVWKLGDDIWEKYKEERRSGYDDLSKVKVRLARHPFKFAILVHIAERIAEEMTNENVAYQVGRTFGEYLEAGILMADVHLGNLGFVAARPDDNDFAPGMPVITDPGHVLVLKRELAQSYIEKL